MSQPLRSIRRAVLAGSAALASGAVLPRAATKITFLTSWFAQVEHGGLAGLDVTIKMGLKVNGLQLLTGGDARVIMEYARWWRNSWLGQGGHSAGLAYEIRQSGFQLDIQHMLAALLLITVPGLALFGLMVGLQHILLGHWHDSAIKTEG